MVLIAAKKKDEERRLRGGDKEKSRPAELRWKWIENYCWHNNCYRNQNQCNDKWDNLLRDYKKVRDYEARVRAITAAGAVALPPPGPQPSPPPPLSYWQLEKHERKERGLPSNLLYQVYESLHEIVDKRYPPRLAAPVSAAAVSSSSANHIQPSMPQPSPLSMLPPPLLIQQDVFHPSPAPHAQLLLQHHQHQLPSPTTLSSKPGISATPDIPQQPSAPSSGAPQQQEFRLSSPVAADPATHLYPSETSDSEDSQLPPSPAKRRKVDAKGTAVATAAKRANELTQVLLDCEDRKDRRHRDLLSMEEKKLMLENTRTQISRDGIAGLIAAINNLAAAVVTLASDKSLDTGD
ncbi:hypothetical protein KP509_15G070800 [Ceratopteris richardii]|nr:hypothetical protein KP509_15G070800 [Ceratopteris richardii]